MSNTRCFFALLVPVILFGCDFKTSSPEAASQDEAWAKLREAEDRLLEPHRLLIQKVEAVGGTMNVLWGENASEEPSFVINLHNSNALDSTLEGLIHDERPLHLLLSNTEVTDAGMFHLEQNRGIVWLSLYGTSVGDACLKSIIKLPSLKSLNLGNTGVTDRGLELLSQLEGLEELRLSENPISDVGIHALSGFPKLRVLTLKEALITDAACEILKNCENIEILNLDGTKVSDVGIEMLSKCQKLKTIWARHTKCTPDGVRQLKKSIPNCEVNL